MHLSRSFVFGVGLTLSAASAFAQDASKQNTVPKAAQPTAPASIHLSQSESEVIDKLHAANKLEIEAGKLAKKNAGSAQVKQFGAKLVTDHTKADQELTTLAKRNGVKLSEVDSARLDALKDLKGEEFDRTFLQMMVTDHKDAIDSVEKAQGEAENKDVKALLNKTLPTLRSHEQHAEKLDVNHS
jgi:putative membrane protein